MGGRNSGRRGWHPGIEQTGCLSLDVRELTRGHASCPPRAQKWQWQRDGQVIDAVIMIALDFPRPSAGMVRLLHGDLDYEVELTATPCHLGGRRWWFLCPRNGRRCAKLYLPRGGRLFWCRQAYNLQYQSQREDAIDAAHRQIERAYRMVGGTHYERFGRGWPRKPKGMHRQTYGRASALMIEGYERLDRAIAACVAPVLAREDDRAAEMRKLVGVAGDGLEQRARQSTPVL